MGEEGSVLLCKMNKKIKQQQQKELSLIACRRNFCHLPTVSPLVLGSHSRSTRPTLSARIIRLPATGLGLRGGSNPPLLPSQESYLEEVTAGVPDLKSPPVAGREDSTWTPRGGAGRRAGGGHLLGGTGQDQEATAAAATEHGEPAGGGAGVPSR